MYESQQKAREAEAAEVRALQELNRQRYQAAHARSVHVHEQNVTKDLSITAAWERNKVHKHNRMVKNLQYEMAVQTFRDLKKRKENYLHAREQSEDIEGFEQNMRRNGFGGDGADDVKLDVTYEDAGLYIKRLEDMLDRKKPSDAEISDFTLRLKKRSKELRQARIEKIRRKRRMMLTQTPSGMSAEETEEAARLESARAEEEAISADALRQTKTVQKQERDAEIAVRAREARDRINAEAEEKLRIFCEEQRMIADANDRSSLVASVEAARADRLAQKHLKNVKMCSLLVQDLIMEVIEKSESLDQTSMNTSLRAGNGSVHLNSNPNLYKMLSNYVREKLSHRIMEDEGLPALHLHDIMGLDMWPSVVCMISNAGLFSGPHSDSSLSGFGCLREVQSSIGDSLRYFVDELLDRFASSSDEEPKNQNKSSTLSVMIPPTKEEIDFLINLDDVGSEDSLKYRCVVVVGHYSSPFVPERRWREAAGWLQHRECVSLWDATRVLESLRLIAAAEVITTFPIAAIMNIFFEKLEFAAGVDGTALLSSIDLPVQAKNVINELNTFYNRLMGYYKDVIQAGKESEPPFDEFTINVMILHMMWLRKCLYDLLSKISAVVNIQAKVAVAILWCSRASTAPNFLVDISRCMSWFLRGCVRSEIPESEPAVQKLIAAEAEREKFIVLPPGTKPAKAAPAKSKAAAKKGAVEEVLYDATPALSAVVVMSDFSEEDERGSDQQESNELLLLRSLSKNVTISAQSLSSVDIDSLGSIFDKSVSIYTLINNNDSATPDLDGLMCKSNFECIENLSSILFDSCGYRIKDSPHSRSDLEERPGSASVREDVTSTARVKALVESRRLRLELVDRVWIDHSNGKYTLRASDVIEAAEQLYLAKKTAIELICPLILSCMLSCVGTRKLFDRKTAEVVNSLKLTDPCFESLCLDFVKSNKTQPGSAPLKHLVSDLGDVVDRRHFEWTSLASTAAAAAEHVLSERVGLVQEEVSQSMALAVTKLLHCAENASKAFAAIFENAGYSTLPWDGVYYLARYNIRSRGGVLRMAFDRRRDVIRANAAELSGVETQDPSFPMVADTPESLWRDFASLDLPSTHLSSGSSSSNGDERGAESQQPTERGDPNLNVSVLQDLHFELAGMAICLQNFLLETSSLLVSYCDDMKSKIEKFIRARSRYEHETLRSWRTAIEVKQGPAATQTLGLPWDSFSSALSADETADGIPMMSLMGSVDLGGMALNASQLRELACELSAIISESSLRLLKIDVAMNLSEMLVKAVSRVRDRGVDLPADWLLPNKIREFSESTCKGLQLDRRERRVEADPCVADAAVRAVVRLILGAAAPPPSMAFIKNVIDVAAAAYTTADATGDITLPIAGFIASVANHPKLREGWWPVPPLDRAQVLEVHHHPPHFRPQATRGGVLNASMTPTTSLHMSKSAVNVSSSTAVTPLNTAAMRSARSGSGNRTAAHPIDNEGALLLEALGYAFVDSTGTVSMSKLVQALCFVPRGTVDTILPLQGAVLRAHDKVPDSPGPEDARTEQQQQDGGDKDRCIIFCRPDLTRSIVATTYLHEVLVGGAAAVVESGALYKPLAHRDAAMDLEGAPSLETLSRLWPKLPPPPSLLRTYTESRTLSPISHAADSGAAETLPVTTEAAARPPCAPEDRLKVGVKRSSRPPTVPFCFVAEDLMHTMVGSELLI
jgi:hypothetical protein